eukprot:12929525-Prorocentrum_lima.AAC.1
MMDTQAPLAAPDGSDCLSHSAATLPTASWGEAHGPTSWRSWTLPAQLLAPWYTVRGMTIGA